MLNTTRVTIILHNPNAFIESFFRIDPLERFNRKGWSYTHEYMEDNTEITEIDDIKYDAFHVRDDKNFQNNHRKLSPDYILKYVPTTYKRVVYIKKIFEIPYLDESALSQSEIKSALQQGLIFADVQYPNLFTKTSSTSTSTTSASASTTNQQNNKTITEPPLLVLDKNGNEKVHLSQTLKYKDVSIFATYNVYWTYDTPDNHNNIRIVYQFCPKHNMKCTYYLSAISDKSLQYKFDKVEYNLAFNDHQFSIFDFNNLNNNDYINNIIKFIIH